MTTLTPSILLLLLAVSFFCACASSSDAPDLPPASSSPLMKSAALKTDTSLFGQGGEGLKGVINRGYLGAGIGREIRIEGVLIDGDTLQTKSMTKRLMLRVEKVNGTPVAGGRLLFWKLGSDVALKGSAKAGDRVSWRGQETVVLAGMSEEELESKGEAVATAKKHTQYWFVVSGESP